jgi:hypothetical protein
MTRRPSSLGKGTATSYHKCHDGAVDSSPQVVAASGWSGGNKARQRVTHDAFRVYVVELHLTCVTRKVLDAVEKPRE